MADENSGADSDEETGAVAQPTTGAGSVDLEMRRLDLERYKAKLQFRRFVLGSVFTAITVAAIPPLFQFATAYLESVRAKAELEAKTQQFRDQYVKDFLSTALRDDIEVRIRFAQYFSSVSSEPAGWVKYLGDLKSLRDTKRVEIDKLEGEWDKAIDLPTLNTLKRHLEWAYNEVGYVAPNRSVTTNPRAPEQSSGPGISLLSIPPEKRPIAQKIIDAFAAAGFGQFQQVAAVANALAESNLDPKVRVAPGGEIGLFLLRPNAGLGAGHTADELMNPDVNIGLVVEAAKKIPAFAAATSLDEAVAIFVRNIQRPANLEAENVRRQQIARQLFRS